MRYRPPRTRTEKDGRPFGMFYLIHTSVHSIDSIEWFQIILFEDWLLLLFILQTRQLSVLLLRFDPTASEARQQYKPPPQRRVQTATPTPDRYYLGGLLADARPASRASAQWRRRLGGIPEGAVPLQGGGPLRACRRGSASPARAGAGRRKEEEGDTNNKGLFSIAYTS